MSERSVSRVITRKGEKPGRDRGQRGKVSSGMVAGPGSNKCGAAGRCHRIRACQRSRCRRRSQLAQNSWRPRGGVNRAGREGHPRAGGAAARALPLPSHPTGREAREPSWSHAATKDQRLSWEKKEEREKEPERRGRGSGRARGRGGGGDGGRGRRKEEMPLNLKLQ